MSVETERGEYLGLIANTKAIDFLSESILFHQIYNWDDYFRVMHGGSPMFGPNVYFIIGSDYDHNFSPYTYYSESYNQKYLYGMATYTKDYLMMQTAKYGTDVLIDLDENNKKCVLYGDKYLAWIKWWNDYFNGLSEEEYLIYCDAANALEDVSMYRPVGIPFEGYIISPDTKVGGTR